MVQWLSPKLSVRQSVWQHRVTSPSLSHSSSPQLKHALIGAAVVAVLALSSCGEDECNNDGDVTLCCHTDCRTDSFGDSHCTTKCQERS